MEFIVELTSRAERDLAAVYEYIHAESSDRAFKWFNGLEAAILSLARQPERSKRTKENSGLRHLLYGNKPHVYRIIYRISKGAGKVQVLHIRHGARQ
jgi:plasmid stabilization system protein ParE